MAELGLEEVPTPQEEPQAAPEPDGLAASTGSTEHAGDSGDEIDRLLRQLEQNDGRPDAEVNRLLSRYSGTED
jgi:hypothetical protein